jgi:hypothetical protein
MADDVSGVEVGTAYVTVLPSTRGFHKALAADVDQASATAGKSGGVAFAGTFTKALPAIGAALAGAFSVQKVVQFAGQSIDAASSLAEAQSKVNVVFGDSAAAINRWAEGSVTGFLLSEQAALAAAGTYGNLFQAFGIGQTKAAEMSTTLVALAADLSSFSDTSVEEALQALQSGLSGETEPLKKYGIALTDARLRQEALNLGIYDGVGILDAAQKAQASYALIMKDSVLAQGDVERTADGYANTTKALTAAVDKAKATIGEGLIDALQAASTSLGGPDGMVALIDNAAGRVAVLTEGFGALIGKIGEIPAALGDRRMEALGNLFGGVTATLPFYAPIKMLWDKSGELLDQKNAWEDVAAEAERAAYMQDVYAGATRSSAVEMSAAATAAEDYDSYLQQMTDRTVGAATGVDTLREALDKFNSNNDVRLAGASIREGWRSLDTMGERVWRGKGKDRRQVQLDFDPTIVDGRFGTDKTGDQGRTWAARIAGSYLDKAELLGGQEAEDLIMRGQRRLARQFREWGIEDPRAYARSFLRPSAQLVAQNNIDQAALDPGNVSDESRRLGSRTTQFIFQGDIKVDSDAALRQAAEEARRLASLASRGAGPLAPVGALG